MPRRLPCLERSIGAWTPCALALAACVALAPAPAVAQSGRMTVTGYVSSRCWVAPSGVAAPLSDRLSSALLPGNARVRCSDTSLRVQVERADALLQVGEAITPGSMTVTISPRS